MLVSFPGPRSCTCLLSATTHLQVVEQLHAALTKGCIDLRPVGMNVVPNARLGPAAARDLHPVRVSPRCSFPHGRKGICELLLRSLSAARASSRSRTSLAMTRVAA